MKTDKIVIIKYPASGESIAYKYDDPKLIKALIEYLNIEEEIVTVATYRDNNKEKETT